MREVEVFANANEYGKLVIFICDDETRKDIDLFDQ